MIDLSAPLAAIDAAFAEPITYNGLPITAIWSDGTAPAFQGAGATARERACEIRKAKIPARPAKADRIVRKGVTYAPIDVADRDDVDAWLVTLELAS